jgi:hypothetical protein
MKKCNTELMKELKVIQELINFSQRNEERKCVITYTQQDRSELENDYDYEVARKELEKLQNEERKIKNLLAISNATTKVIGYDITIAESLVYLAQLSQNKALLSKMAGREKLSRRTTYSGDSEYTKACYDIKKAQADLADVNREIAKLQMAIDRTNLNNIIDC